MNLHEKVVLRLAERNDLVFLAFALRQSESKAEAVRLTVLVASRLNAEQLAQLNALLK